jgi:hypothetical protein
MFARPVAVGHNRHQLPALGERLFRLQIIVDDEVCKRRSKNPSLKRPGSPVAPE